MIDSVNIGSVDTATSETGSITARYNVPGMLPAAAMSYGALADTFVDVPVYPVFQSGVLR